MSVTVAAQAGGVSGERGLMGAEPLNPERACTSPGTPRQFSLPHLWKTKLPPRAFGLRATPAVSDESTMANLVKAEKEVRCEIAVN